MLTQREYFTHIKTTKCWFRAANCGLSFSKHVMPLSDAGSLSCHSPAVTRGAQFLRFQPKDPPPT